MRELIISKNEAGQRFDKYLHKRLPNAGSSFLYKMLRKKNIVLNAKKADGSEKLVTGDKVQIYFSDETYEKFAGISSKDTETPFSRVESAKKTAEYVQGVPADRLDILYEDDDILILNKPAGMLSQKAKPEDISANEYLISYLLASGQLTKEELTTFRPSVCNRLDRNTSGLLTAGKSMKGLQELSAMLKDRTVKKYYRCLVSGRIEKEAWITGWLYKDEKTNQVQIRGTATKDAKYIETAYKPLVVKQDVTLLEVHLITGRSHQIRAHLASVGHPIVGDRKYGDSKINNVYQKRFGIRSQLLHAYRMEFPDGRQFVAPLPPEFDRILTNEE